MGPPHPRHKRAFPEGVIDSVPITLDQKGDSQHCSKGFWEFRGVQTEKEFVFLKQQQKFPFVISESRIYLFYSTYSGPSFHQSDSRIATAYKNKLPKQQRQLIKISQVKNQSSGNSEPRTQNHLTMIG